MTENEKLSIYSSKIVIAQLVIGGSKKMLMCGPCAIESEQQIRQVAQLLQKMEIPIMRGGAFKPRTSINSFQGMGRDGLELMVNVCNEYGLKVVTELLDPRDCDLFLKLGVDIIQIGTRNMLNYSLLKEVGKTRTPILLKRGFMSTVQELILASEYILDGGNDQVIFCERGIRTFESQTRNTLDLSCVPLIKQAIGAPIIVDLSHSLGRTDIILPMAKAALASGSDGLMIEIHPNPSEARSDGKQSLSFVEFEELIITLDPFMRYIEGQ
jgi:3-deoxy-7-phosphoheptulonate synthase / chorismate mutase